MTAATWRAEERTLGGLDVFERIGDQHGRAECWTTLGMIAFERGDLAVAARQCRVARRLARRPGLSQPEALATLGLVRVFLRAGRLRIASVLLDYGRQVASAHDLLPEMTHVMLANAEAQVTG